ncbi:MAG: PD-(D/E)XK nuclease family protein [Candidatus Gastranaerophilales bacterium]|nr:PD-(D/E)XK nuclease family protein [Candidatus Gastranaerophilales bacterium]
MELITKKLDTAESIQMMLRKAAEITKKYDTIAQSTGSSFNMFELTHVAGDEVRMCRVLADLLNPEGTHRQGRIYLDLFFETVLEREKPVKDIKVKREVVIEGDRRIDIVIESDGNVIPIEVKINAGDQPNQLYDYAQRSKGIEKPKVYYLTKFGTEPSNDSCCNSSKNEILNITDIGCLSWSYDILKWLDACISHYNTYTKAPIREILIQYAAVIRKFTDQLEENEKMEIEEILLKTPENLKSAYDIASTLESAELILWNKFCEAVKRELEANFGILPERTPDNWNLVYLNKTNENTQTYAWINSDNKKEIRKMYHSELFSSKAVNEGTFSILELVDANNFIKIIQECAKWIADKLNKQTTT